MKKIFSLPAICITLGILAAACSKEPSQQSPDEPENNFLITGEASKITEGTAEISCTALFDGDKKRSGEYGVQYSDVDLTCYGTFSKTESIDSDGNYNVTLSNLRQNTLYYYRAYVLDQGIRTFGKVKSFKTLDFNAWVNTAEIQDPGMFSATLSGTMTTDMKQNVGAEQVQPFFLMAKSEDELNDPEASRLMVTEASFKDGVWTFGRSADVEPGTMYYCRAGVILYGKEFLGGIKTFTTSDFTYAAVPVDMGLSVKWASWNLGATAPEEAGAYFAWGETKPKSSYTWNNYIIPGEEIHFYKYPDNPSLLPEHDAAHLHLGGTWRIPTEEEFKELLQNCVWTWTNVNDINGIEVRSCTTGNSIFIPAVGSGDHDQIKFWNQYGDYWTSSKGENDSSWAKYCLIVPKEINGGPSIGNSVKYIGMPVRPVCD